ncbi:mitogen-activated protein kinase organizer 1 [Mytilinidion resinicola]|uniref:Mitogen-activated protein kinase organizer 1 n=1 Tax=Mytilinidion resinicola TaxID=574789 RepID=A0A6A6XZB6_9PEZI|nr:mitogen-activated protein kinase organizer 1 [Mytilinidion resinicola]KAF2801750.1 mitogen-activated protein kinase organizer 1 [Mytilinidion resinicola]
MSSQFPTRQIARLGGHNGAVHAVTYSAGSSQYILTGSTDHTIRLFNPSKAASPGSVPDPSLPTPGLIQTYDAHGYEVLDLAVSADNARLISVGGDKTVFLWDVSRATTIKRWTGHAGKVNSCAFGGTEGSVVVSGSYDGTVRLWDAKSQSYKPIMVLSEARDSVSSVAVMGAEIVAGSVDGRVRCYDIRMGQMLVDVIGAPVTSLTPTKNTDSLLVSSLDSTIRLMDKPDGKLLKAYRAPEYTNTDYRIRSTLGLSDSIILSGSESGHILIWDLLTGNPLHKLRHSPATQTPPNPKKDVVSAVAFCPTRREWASAGGDGNVIVWGMPA